jgi:hypothetical protein
MIKQIVLFYGAILIVIAVVFWYKFHRKIKNFPLPPVTTIVIFIGVIMMYILMEKNDIVKIIFGGESQLIRTNILNMLGVIFTGFILVIAISWGLIAGNVGNVNKTVYFQSYILAGLFFYIAAAFYCILVDL